MQCPVCGKEVEAQSAFCKHCGAAVTGAAPGAAGYTSVPNYGSQGYTAIPPQPGTMPPMAVNAGLSDNAAAAISYITIIPAIIFLVLEPYNRIPLVRFHAWQSIGLFLGGILLHFAAGIFGVTMHFIPFMHLFVMLIEMVISLGLFIVWIIAILKASKGEWYKLPVIGDFAEKQARGQQLV